MQESHLTLKLEVTGMTCDHCVRAVSDALAEVPGVKVGDEAEIISSQLDAPHSVENLARLAGTVPYEIITRLGDRITRVISD